MARRFAKSFGAGDWAGLAGRWHDLGKYQSAFQRYIGAASGYRPNAHIEQVPGSVKHAIVGAVHAGESLDGAEGRILAYLIAGHHAGLHDWNSDVSSLARQLEEGSSLYKSIQGIEEIEDMMAGEVPASRPPHSDAVSLWIRMIFSCLVDADFLDTEQFMDPERATRRVVFPPLEELKPVFDIYMNRLQRSVREDGNPSKVNRIRSDILKRCRSKAALEPGLFSLSVPTGGGKTLASMGFALDHAIRHGKRRIIYVIPYLSIIEQTVDVFRGIFGEEIVIEHHSSLDPEKETAENRLACENWDASMVVTTGVRFFESLFASRTSRARKLHNIVDSVVILDEAQLLPPDYLLPILETLNHLAEHFGVTILLMTATQPALEERKEEDFDFAGLRNVREIMDDVPDLHRKLRRVEVQIPENLSEPRSWEDIGQCLLTHPRVLCIVNSRRDCRELYGIVASEDPNAIHLSALMCGEHRAATIEWVKERLARGDAVRVVSTQLIEAGVDLDFPVVYRALAGIDSIAQAAGRCNREGLQDKGRVVVFVPPKPAPAGHLRQAESCGRQILSLGGEPLSPGSFDRFFRLLYWLKGDGLDRKGIRSHLKTTSDLSFRFRTTGHDFHLIDDSSQAPVIVRYGQSIDSLVNCIERFGPTRKIMRPLQRKIVNIYDRDRMMLASVGAIREVHSGVFVQEDTTLYDSNLGLIVEPKAIRQPEGMIT